MCVYVYEREREGEGSRHVFVISSVRVYRNCWINEYMHESVGVAACIQVFCWCGCMCVYVYVYVCVCV